MFNQEITLKQKLELVYITLKDGGRDIKHKDYEKELRVCYISLLINKEADILNTVQ